MRLFRHVRSKSKIKDSHSTPEAVVYPNYSGRDVASTLEARILERIFVFVCPHAQDDMYTTCEEATADGCMLCDTRDLAHCSMVCKSWSAEALRLL